MIGKTNKAYFRAAKAVSELSERKQKLGCVIVDKHRIISSACNTNKCHPIQARLDTEKYGVSCPGQCHAEVSALLPLIRDKVDLSNASIYVFRQHKDGSLAMAKPCSSCQKMIRQMKIKKCFYTIENGYAVEKW